MEDEHPTLEDYFKDHPEEEEEYLQYMEERFANDEVIDYQEYWLTNDWIQEIRA